jgi:hypothetical protein
MQSVRLLESVGGEAIDPQFKPARVHCCEFRMAAMSIALSA